MNREKQKLEVCAYALVANTKNKISKPSFHGTIAKVETQLGVYSCTYTAVQDQTRPVYHMQSASVLRLNDGRTFRKLHDETLINFDVPAVIDELQHMIQIFHNDVQQKWFVPNC